MDEMPWIPTWTLWVLLPWVLLHLIYDLKIGEELRKDRGASFHPFTSFSYRETLRETSRRFRQGDLMATVVTWYDRVIVAVLLLWIVSSLLYGNVPAT